MSSLDYELQLDAKNQDNLYAIRMIVSDKSFAILQHQRWCFRRNEEKLCASRRRETAFAFGSLKAHFHRREPALEGCFDLNLTVL